MNDYFPRAGPEPYGRLGAPLSLRDGLAELRGRVRDGLAEAASRAASGAVRRAAECLLGAGDEATGQSRLRRRGYGAGWGREYEDDYGDGRDGSWHDHRHGRQGLCGRDDDEDAA